MQLDWLKQWDLYSPESVAIKDGETGENYTYRKLFQQSCKGAAFLQATYSIGTGDRVAVLATNELEYVFLFFALQRLGAILVPINFRLTQREVDHIISDADPKLILCLENYLPLLEKTPATTSGPRPILLLKGPGGFAEQLDKKMASAALKTSAFSAPAINEDSPVMILYTSGTTGAPKGALITHKMLFWNSINTTMSLNISQQDCTVIFLPFFHTGGWNVLTTPFLHRGAKVVFLKKFDADQILQLCEQEKATVLFGVPTTMDMMYRSSSFAKTNLTSIRFAIVGGEPMPVDLIQAWDKKGIPVRQGYGLTEFGPNVFSLHEKDAIRKIGSIGFPNFYIQAKVVDDQSQEVGANQIGELILSGPTCMPGYWKNDKATKETLKNDWMYTGDLVRKDEEGYFYVVGRKKDMYKSGGENVYPPELEQVIRQLPGVQEVAVIGVPDEKWGEVGKAFVVPQPQTGDAGQILTQEKLQQHCIQNLAKFKIPKYFVFIDSLPKGDSGKILKRKLAEM
ncbi:MAG: acyl-CoA synthetase [Pseudobdellovibrionaceae bacterium]